MHSLAGSRFGLRWCFGKVHLTVGVHSLKQNTIATVSSNATHWAPWQLVLNGILEANVHGLFFESMVVASFAMEASADGRWVPKVSITQGHGKKAQPSPIMATRKLQVNDTTIAHKTAPAYLTLPATCSSSQSHGASLPANKLYSIPCQFAST